MEDGRLGTNSGGLQDVLFSHCSFTCYPETIVTVRMSTNNAYSYSRCGNGQGWLSNTRSRIRARAHVHGFGEAGARTASHKRRTLNFVHWHFHTDSFNLLNTASCAIAGRLAHAILARLRTNPWRAYSRSLAGWPMRPCRACARISGALTRDRWQAGPYDPAALAHESLAPLRAIAGRLAYATLAHLRSSA